MEPNQILKDGLLLFTFFILLYLIVNIFTPIIKFKPISDWWNQEDPDEKYRDFDLVSLAYWEYFPLYYYVRILTSSERYRFESNAWVYFLTSLIYGGGKDLVPGGWVTPKSICEAIVPIDWKPTNGADPGTMSISDWKTMIGGWGITWSNSPKKYTYDANKWTQSKDNFLSGTWAIPGDSPIVKAFVTNWSTDENGDPIYPSAMEPLLGFKNGISSGGWYGFLQSGDGFKGMGVFEIKRQIWADSVPGQFGKAGIPSSCSSGSALAGYLTGGIGTGLGAAMMIAMSAGMGPLAILGGLVGTGLGAALTAGSQGCL